MISLYRNIVYVNPSHQVYAQMADKPLITVYRRFKFAVCSGRYVYRDSTQSSEDMLIL